jgi:hypothetical protein
VFGTYVSRREDILKMCRLGEDWIIWFKIGAIAGLFADSDETSGSLNVENICYL